MGTCAHSSPCWFDQHQVKTSQDQGLCRNGRLGHCQLSVPVAFTKLSKHCSANQYQGHAAESCVVGEATCGVLAVSSANICQANDCRCVSLTGHALFDPGNDSKLCKQMQPSRFVICLHPHEG